MDDEISKDDFSLSTYINKKFNTYSYSAVNTAYNMLKHQSANLNINILALLNINFDFSIYNRSYQLLRKAKKLLKTKATKTHPFILNRENIKKFKEVLGRFAENLSMFVNETRFLEEAFEVKLKILSGKFIQKDIEQNQFRKGLVIFTNDIILIGMEKRGFEKYILLNTYSYGSLKMELTSKIVLETGSASFEIACGERRLYRMKGVYDKYTYLEGNRKLEKRETSSSKNKFYYETEQFEKINIKKTTGRVNFHEKIRSIDNLKIFLQIGDPKQIFYSLFKKNLPGFSFDNFIEIYFSYLDQFSEEQEKYVSKEMALILYEMELRYILRFTMKQVLWRGRPYKNMVKMCEEVKSRCKIEYLFDEYESKIERWKKRRIEFGKKELRKSVEEFTLNK